MLACLDVDYRAAGAMAACLCFTRWEAKSASRRDHAWLTKVEPYVSGEFFRRELPCLLEVLARLPSRPQLLIVDSYVWLEGERPGMGAHLFHALNDAVAVVGVAKTQMLGAPAVEVLRGESQRPLYVSAVGIDVTEAAENVRRMDGRYRMPTLLREVDRLARDAVI